MYDEWPEWAGMWFDYSLEFVQLALQVSSGSHPSYSVSQVAAQDVSGV